MWSQVKVWPPDNILLACFWSLTKSLAALAELTIIVPRLFESFSLALLFNLYSAHKGTE